MDAHERGHLVPRHRCGPAFPDGRRSVPGRRRQRSRQRQRRSRWMQHGNGGGTSGGTFAPTAAGGRWQIGGARLDTGVAWPISRRLRHGRSHHEIPYTQSRTHTALRATVPAGNADALQLLYPTPPGRIRRRSRRSTKRGRAGLDLVDASGDRHVIAHVTAVERRGSVVDEHLDGSLRLAFGDDLTELATRWRSR